MRVLSALFFGFLSIQVFAASPWSVPVERSVPWDVRDPSRKAARENFFDSLARDAGIERVAVYSPFGGVKNPNQAEREEDSEDEASRDLNRLPWKEYQSEWEGRLGNLLLWPVADGRISSGYGVRRGMFHEGLDITGSEGSAIRVAANGKVVFVGRMSGYGNTIVVYHGAGYSTIYAHNRDNLVRKGQILLRSQVIGTLGSTGHASGPHVHFEVRKHGKPVNPFDFEFDRKTSARDS